MSESTMESDHSLENLSDLEEGSNRQDLVYGKGTGKRGRWWFGGKARKRSRNKTVGEREEKEEESGN